VKGIDLVKCDKVEANPYVPHSYASDPVEAISGLFPTCAMTHTMARRNWIKLEMRMMKSVKKATVQPVESLILLSVSSESEPEIYYEPTQQTNELEFPKSSLLSVTDPSDGQNDRSQVNRLSEKWNQIR